MSVKSSRVVCFTGSRLRVDFNFVLSEVIYMDLSDSQVWTNHSLERFNQRRWYNHGRVKGKLGLWLVKCTVNELSLSVHVETTCLINSLFLLDLLDLVVSENKPSLICRSPIYRVKSLNLLLHSSGSLRTPLLSFSCRQRVAANLSVWNIKILKNG